MSYFSYFKYFNQVNKINKDIRNNLNYINYDDLLLELIFDEINLHLAKIVFPLVENKLLICRFIEILNFYYFTACKREWLEVILSDEFIEDIPRIIEIDSIYFEQLLISSSQYGFINAVKKLVENRIEYSHDSINKAFSYACKNYQTKIAEYLIENGADMWSSGRELTFEDRNRYDYTLDCITRNNSKIREKYIGGLVQNDDFYYDMN